ncbi:bacterioferritin-associated ferredoxin [Telmatospirillum sp. J64-1]|uniref:(2Fe-2S)-binding protein n=1 Tax=Telmatospirillum sp. J64-1 TaxID=2502183 RepID=UPI00115C5DC3|nr:(2Fe-2S)-binding protein [Telmatospirillum sp. J64-1]
MIVCVCNNLNEKKVNQAIGAGACSAAQVFKHTGTRPQCGRCLTHMRDMLVRENEARMLEMKMAAE